MVGQSSHACAEKSHVNYVQEAKRLTHHRYFVVGYEGSHTDTTAFELELFCSLADHTSFFHQLSSKTNASLLKGREKVTGSTSGKFEFKHTDFDLQK